MRDKALLAQALVIVPLVRLALWTLPFRFVHRVVARFSGPPASSPADLAASRRSAESIVHAVVSVSSRIPRASCLTQALAASILLSRHGHDATLRIGVAKDGRGRLRAHAWLESNGATILGEPTPGEFHALPPLVLS